MAAGSSYFGRRAAWGVAQFAETREAGYYATLGCADDRDATTVPASFQRPRSSASSFRFGPGRKLSAPGGTPGQRHGHCRGPEAAVHPRPTTGGER
jgi:hypothetical protein